MLSKAAAIHDPLLPLFDGGLREATSESTGKATMVLKMHP